MKTHTRLATAFLAAATLLMPFQASAMSVRQFETHPIAEQVQIVHTAIDKIIADVARVNPDLSKAIHDYFYVSPPGQREALGPSNFAAALGAVENLADKGKFDLDKVQIEGILLDIIKTDVMPAQVQISRNTSPSVQR